MTAPRYIGVIDIGKTNAKFAVVDLADRQEVAMRRMANTVLAGPPYPHFNIEALWQFLCIAIADLNREYRLDALSVTTHGASAALVDADGALALPVLDYEFDGPDRLEADYARVRPAFSESFTPPLPGGLNVGKQLFWQARTFPSAFARARWVLTYPQYWSFRLTGIAASEITSLGCHTDLWDFRSERFSSLVEGQGWAGKFPAVRPASDILGPVRPELAQQLGLKPELPVYSGIHDSNASLLPHVLARTPPFSVVSTGTWVVVFAPGGQLGGLDPSRDSFSNIDALGRHVPSARFMGGREFSLLTGEESRRVPDEAVIRVLEEGIMLWPAVVPGSGPFPRARMRWSTPPERLNRDEIHAAASFYLALMTAECLGLVGAEGETVLEGPFVRNPLYVSMLAVSTGRPVEAQTSSATGTSVGAALLAQMEGRSSKPARIAGWIGKDLPFQRYAEKWRRGLSG